MDFIERLFGFAPDGGSGSLELAFFAILAIGLGYLMLKRLLDWQPRKSTS